MLLNPNPENINIVDDIISECTRYVDINFDNIIPFQITNGYDFQIRMTEKTFLQVPEKYKEELRKFAIPDKYDYSIEGEVLERYKKDFFWINCNEYIFNFKIKKGVCVNTNCKYGPEGIEDCKNTILFIDKKELTPFILLNIDLEGSQQPKYPIDTR